MLYSIQTINRPVNKKRGKMKNSSNNLFEKFDISFFSKKYLNKDIIRHFYTNDLKTKNKRTRSDSIIECHHMILFICLWVLNPEEGCFSVLNKAKCFLLKTSKNVRHIVEAITDSGLCKARKRFSSDILKRLWQNNIIPVFYKEKGRKLWKGFTVCAVDGTSLTLNLSEKILKSFPLISNSLKPKMLMCVLYDVYSKIPLDVICSNFPGNERGLLINMIRKIEDNNILLLLDRGYPSFVLFYLFSINPIQSVVRIPSFINYKKVKKIGTNDFIVKIHLNKDKKYLAKKYLTADEYNNLPDFITLRSVKAQRKGFRPRFILTSLMDNSIYSYQDICKLYCDRWIIENYYRDLKHILKIDKFHAKYEDGIYQEIYAAMILTIILQQYIVKAHVRFNIAYEEISFKKTFKIISQFIFFFDFFPDSLLLENLLLHLIANSSQKKRPDRSFKRIFYRKIKTKSNKWK